MAKDQRDGRRLVVVGASAGGVEALTRLVGALPPGFRAAVLVVLHVTPSGPSVLPAILTRAGRLQAAHVEDGMAIEPGRIFVAPPDEHLLVEDGRMRLSHGPRENGHRPAIDPLFRSAAQHYGSRVVGILLSGNLSDGTAGLVSIKQRSGIAIVQDPESARYSGIPRSAIERVPVDHVVPVEAMAGLLDHLTAEPAPSSIRAVLSTGVLEHDLES
jgi:two-component system, chemotaxis family, protein-glutamate methylesterase/glutaminase